VQLDGDVVARTPVSFGIAPAALRVIAPTCLPTDARSRPRTVAALRRRR
jgi:hypothetical protein